MIYIHVKSYNAVLLVQTSFLHVYCEILRVHGAGALGYGVPENILLHCATASQY